MKKVIKLITLNCYGSPISFNRAGRFQKIAEEIQKLKPDIIFLQEVFFESDRKILEENLIINGWEVFPKTYSRFGPGGLLTFVKNLEIKSSGFFKFSDQGPNGIFSSADRIAGKGFQFIKAKLKNKNFFLINAHLLCLYNQKPKYTKAFDNQLKELANFTQKNKKENVILAGDLNILPEEKRMVNFMKTLNLKDNFDNNLHTVVPTNTNRLGFVKPFVSQTIFRCDYILTHKKLTKQNPKVIFDKPYKIDKKETHLSDHFGLSLEAVI